jgi:hypothetical protein
MLHLRLEIIILIQIRHAIQSFERHFMNIRNRIVRMQRLLEDQRHGSIVRYRKLHRQCASDRKLIRKPKIIKAQSATELRRSQRKRQMQIIARQRCKGQRPVLYARKPMRGSRLSVMPIGKPRKRNRHSTTNRLAWREFALAANKNHRLLPLRLPRRHMRALQINRCARLRCSDTPVDQSTGRRMKSKNARQSKMFVQLLNIQSLLLRCA